MIVMALLLGVLTAATEVAAGEASSYESLKGERLARFHASGGRSEWNHDVSIEVAASAILKLTPLRPGSTRVRFESRGIPYLIDRDDPGLLQARRKVLKKEKVRLLVKGRVLPLKDRAPKSPACEVRVATIQAFGQLRRRG